MKFLLAFVAYASVVYASSSLVERAPAPTITISNGVVIGSSNATLNQDRFLGIPYALPPTGTRRLVAPQSLTSNFGTLTATASPSACPQLGTSTTTTIAASSSASAVATGSPNVFSLFGPQTPSSEDCLYLNVQRPTGTNSTSKLPVLAWIYGGGFQTGSTSFYDGFYMLSKAMSYKLPYIFVAMNYRQAAFGFLGGQQLAAEGNTNLGLRDQRAAFEWIADNIAAFGGDPTRVTIWGESAGSWAVMDHTTINNGNNLYNGQPLFHGAMMDSGATFPALPVASNKSQNIFNGLATQAGCDYSSPTVLQCLRSVNYTTFLAAQNSQIKQYPHISLTYIARPDPSSSFFSTSPEEAVKAGNFTRVPIICGNQQDEGASFSLLSSNEGINGSSDLSLLQVFQPVFPEALAPNLVSFFDTYSTNASDGCPYNTGQAYETFPGAKRFAAIVGDTVFILARRLYLSYVSSVVNAWSYSANYDHNVPVLGTTHGTDVLAMWRGILLQPTDAVNQLHTRYISFINYLDPNKLAVANGLAAWPQYTTSGASALQLLQFNQEGVTIIQDNFRNSSYMALQAYDTSFKM